MRAVVVTRPGPPGVLALREVPDPACGPDQVRIAVRATALNRADLLQRRGRYPAPPGVPADILGLEFAGEVTAKGSDVDEPRVGERVMGIVAGGAYAEMLCVHHGLCVRIPDRLGWEEAAALPEAFFTAYDALFVQGGLRAEETVLLHAAASGIGTAAAQLAGAAGARVIGLSRSADKRERLTQRGLMMRALDPAAGDVDSAIRESTDGHGVDLVLDLYGASTWGLTLDVLRPGGRVVVLGLLGGARVDLDLSVVMSKRLLIRGSVLRSRGVEEKIELTRSWVTHVLPWIAEGQVRPIVDRCYPLSEAAEAHAYMESNRNFGKVVLSVAG